MNGRILAPATTTAPKKQQRMGAYFTAAPFPAASSSDSACGNNGNDANQGRGNTSTETARSREVNEEDADV